MDLIFFVGAILFGILGYLVTDEYEKPEGILGGALLGFMVSFILWFFIGLSTKGEDSINGNLEEYVAEKTNLRAFKDGTSSSVGGSFFLGIGTFSGGGSIYYGYADIGDNRYKQVKFYVDEAVIVEDIDTNQQPYYVQIRERLKDSVYKERLKRDHWMMGPYKDDDFKRWEIHIPKGTIIQTFELDLE